MQFAGTNETYHSTWFAYKITAFLVDRDKPRGTLSTASMNFVCNFLANITPFILAVLCSLISDYLGTYTDDLCGVVLMGNNALLFPLSIFSHNKK
jgi:hypothetical protein